MEICPDCRMPIELEPHEELDSLDGLWCECPILKVEPYLYDPDEEEDLNEPAH